MLKKFRRYLAESEKCFYPARGALSVLQISANLKARTKPIVSAGSSFAERRGTIDFYLCYVRAQPVAGVKIK